MPNINALTETVQKLRLILLLSLKQVTGQDQGQRSFFFFFFFV